MGIDLQRSTEIIARNAETITTLRVENESLARERDCFRAVLEGAEYRDIAGIAEKGTTFGLRLGQDAKNLTIAAMLERDALRARVAELIADNERLRTEIRKLNLRIARCERWAEPRRGR